MIRFKIQKYNIIGTLDTITTIIFIFQYQVASASSQANVTSSASGVAASVFSSAPERPAKPFDLYFKAQMDAHAGDTNFDRQSCAEKYRAEWKTMKLKKKAKWIKKAAENYR